MPHISNGVIDQNVRNVLTRTIPRVNLRMPYICMILRVIAKDTGR